MATITYHCPYPHCGWELTIPHNTTEADILYGEAGETVVDAHLRRADGVERELARHLEGTHPGWTLEEVAALSERKRRDLGPFGRYAQ